MTLEIYEEPSQEVEKVSQLLLALNLDGKISIKNGKTFEKTLDEFLTPRNVLKKQQEHSKLEETKEDKCDATKVDDINFLSKQESKPKVKKSSALQSRKPNYKMPSEETNKKEVHLDERQNDIINAFVKLNITSEPPKQRRQKVRNLINAKKEDSNNSETSVLIKTRGVTKVNKVINHNPDQKSTRLSECISIGKGYRHQNAQKVTIPPSPSSGYGSPISEISNSPQSVGFSPAQALSTDIPDWDILNDSLLEIFNDDDFKFLDLDSLSNSELDAGIDVSSDGVNFEFQDSTDFTSIDSGYSSPGTADFGKISMAPVETSTGNIADVLKNPPISCDENLFDALLNSFPSSTVTAELSNRTIHGIKDHSNAALVSTKTNSANTGSISFNKANCEDLSHTVVSYNSTKQGLTDKTAFRPDISINHNTSSLQKSFNKEMGQICNQDMILQNHAYGTAVPNLPNNKGVMVVQQPVFLVCMVPPLNGNNCSAVCNNKNCSKAQRVPSTKKLTKTGFMPIQNKDKINPARSALKRILNRANADIYQKAIYNDVRLCDKDLQPGRREFRVIYIVDEENKQTNLHKAVINRELEVIFLLVEIQRQYEERKLAEAVRLRDVSGKSAQDYIVGDHSPAGQIVFGYLDFYCKN